MYLNGRGKTQALLMKTQAFLNGVGTHFVFGQCYFCAVCCAQCVGEIRAQLLHVAHREYGQQKELAVFALTLLALLVQKYKY
jgi:hypothetical protein